MWDTNRDISVNYTRNCAGKVPILKVKFSAFKFYEPRNLTKVSLDTSFEIAVVAAISPCLY